MDKPAKRIESVAGSMAYRKAFYPEADRVDYKPKTKRRGKSKKRTKQKSFEPSAKDVARFAVGCEYTKEGGDAKTYPLAPKSFHTWAVVTNPRKVEDCLHLVNQGTPKSIQFVKKNALDIDKINPSNTKCKTKAGRSYKPIPLGSVPGGTKGGTSGNTEWRTKSSTTNMCKFAMKRLVYCVYKYKPAGATGTTTNHILEFGNGAGSRLFCPFCNVLEGLRRSISAGKNHATVGFDFVPECDCKDLPRFLQVLQRVSKDDGHFEFDIETFIKQTTDHLFSLFDSYSEEIFGDDPASAPMEKPTDKNLVQWSLMTSGPSIDSLTTDLTVSIATLDFEFEIDLLSFLINKLPEKARRLAAHFDLGAAAVGTVSIDIPLDIREMIRKRHLIQKALTRSLARAKSLAGKALPPGFKNHLKKLIDADSKLGRKFAKRIALKKGASRLAAKVGVKVAAKVAARVALRFVPGLNIALLAYDAVEIGLAVYKIADNWDKITVCWPGDECPDKPSLLETGLDVLDKPAAPELPPAFQERLEYLQKKAASSPCVDPDTGAPCKPLSKEELEEFLSTTDLENWEPPTEPAKKTDVDKAKGKMPPEIAAAFDKLAAGASPPSEFDKADMDILGAIEWDKMTPEEQQRFLALLQQAIERAKSQTTDGSYSPETVVASYKEMAKLAKQGKTELPPTSLTIKESDLSDADTEESDEDVKDKSDDNGQSGGNKPNDDDDQHGGRKEGDDDDEDDEGGSDVFLHQCKVEGQTGGCFNPKVHNCKDGKSTKEGGCTQEGYKCCLGNIILENAEAKDFPKCTGEGDKGVCAQPGKFECVNNKDRSKAIPFAEGRCEDASRKCCVGRLKLKVASKSGGEGEGENGENNQVDGGDNGQEAAGDVCKVGKDEGRCFIVETHNCEGGKARIRGGCNRNGGKDDGKRKCCIGGKVKMKEGVEAKEHPVCKENGQGKPVSFCAVPSGYECIDGQFSESDRCEGETKCCSGSLKKKSATSSDESNGGDGGDDVGGQAASDKKCTATGVSGEGRCYSPMTHKCEGSTGHSNGIGCDPSATMCCIGGTVATVSPEEEIEHGPCLGNGPKGICLDPSRYECEGGSFEAVSTSRCGTPFACCPGKAKKKPSEGEGDSGSTGDADEGTVVETETTNVDQPGEENVNAEEPGKEEPGKEEPDDEPELSPEEQKKLQEEKKRIKDCTNLACVTSYTQFAKLDKAGNKLVSLSDEKKLEAMLNKIDTSNWVVLDLIAEKGFEEVRSGFTIVPLGVAGDGDTTLHLLRVYVDVMLKGGFVKQHYYYVEWIYNANLKVNPKQRVRRFHRVGKHHNFEKLIAPKCDPAKKKEGGTLNEIELKGYPTSSKFVVDGPLESEIQIAAAQTKEFHSHRMKLRLSHAGPIKDMGKRFRVNLQFTVEEVKNADGAFVFDFTDDSKTWLHAIKVEKGKPFPFKVYFDYVKTNYKKCTK